MPLATLSLSIPPDELSSIFERFVRVENPQARSIEGSGIGLSLTLELVKAHGGKIGVERWVPIVIRFILPWRTLLMLASPPFHPHPQCLAQRQYLPT